MNSYAHRHKRRIEKTLKFVKKHIEPGLVILDLGVSNPISEAMSVKGYKVTNTDGRDIDIYPEMAHVEGFDVVTAFEILEHLVNPFSVLKDIKAPNLIASVPLNLWFSSAFWDERDPFNRHYHEFEVRQFQMLLDKAGWEIIDSEKWINKPGSIGFRSLLRLVTPRHIAVYCRRKQEEGELTA